MAEMVNEFDQGSGQLRKLWDIYSSPRAYREFDSGGAQTLTRALTVAENAQADAIVAGSSRLAALEARMTALEARVSALEPVPAAGSEPTFAVLTGRQNGAIYVGQRFVWTDGKVYRCTVGPLNSNATPVTYPQGYALLNPPAAPAWVAGKAYAVNDLATYNSVTYKCIQAHTSQVGWEPPNVPALWAPA